MCLDPGCLLTNPFLFRDAGGWYSVEEKCEFNVVSETETEMEVLFLYRSRGFKTDDI
jgi:hypothetical protein